MSRIVVVGLLLLTGFFLSVGVSADTGSIGIPYKLTQNAQESSSIELGKGNVTIQSSKGTDLFTNSDGSFSKNNAPRLFFEPRSDFSFSLKVTTDFKSPYDGGAIFIYADSDTWAKLLFERFKSGKNGVASTVVETTGDDAYHYIHDVNHIFLKIQRKSDSYIFYQSKDGNTWSYLRSFSLKTSKPIQLGVMAQSPISENLKVFFSDITFEE